MKKNPGINLVYITAKDKREAERIGRSLVKLRLAACVNIIDGMNSIYRWKGKVERAREAILIAKTKKSLTRKLIKKVKSMHSYSCPSVISLPVLGGNSQYLKWIQEETE